MITGIYFDAETRSFSAEDRMFTAAERNQALIDYKIYKSRGGKKDINTWMTDQRSKGRAAFTTEEMKHGLNRTEAKKLDQKTRDAIAKSIKNSRANEGSMNVHNPSAASHALKAKMNLNTPGVKGAAIGAGAVAATAGAAYAANRIIASRKAKKAKEEATNA